MPRHTPNPPHETDAPRTLLSVEEAARRLSIGRTTMFGLLKSGAITSVQIGRLRRVPATALTTYAEHLATGQPHAA
ncbi:helix-turn-helix domain-containing protein [Lentzea sp. PSKA42]|uniref:Helix-turn-helix domain-containing protein n=1 Tax=Lentzea indica TaxID=2604800 RepID=A0ABX1FK75_9PSEU|nr:excisionase family DNA-binding protein [Lentzea indica]NKE59393.1 helix-turn-helix domain-containing protein [Lentzea indica]